MDHKALAGHLRFARAYTADKLPWFAPALFRCRIIITPRVDVAAIDLHYNVYWNPDVVADIWAKPRPQSLAELGFLWVHEISHRLRQHAERAQDSGLKGPEQARWWNVAADFEINDARWPGLRMPTDYPGMLPHEHDLPNGRLAEHYYAEVQRRFPQLKAPHDDGSGAHGQDRDWETGPQQQRLSTLEDQVLRRDTAQRMKQAGDKARPGSWRDWSDDVLTPQVNWRQSLGHRMSVALQHGIGSRIDYSFQRPSRRQSVYYPILTPSLRGDRTARIVIVVDTSGSMPPDLLLRAMTEVSAVIRTFQYPVTIIPCDTQAYEPVRLLAEAEAFRLQQLEGGGGTDMAAGIKAAIDLQPTPDSILVLTDGLTPYPPQRFAVPVVFGIFDLDEQVRRKPPNPPWGKDTVVAIREL